MKCRTSLSRLCPRKIKECKSEMWQSRSRETEQRANLTYHLKSYKLSFKTKLKKMKIRPYIVIYWELGLNKSIQLLKIGYNSTDLYRKLELKRKNKNLIMFKKPMRREWKKLPVYSNKVSKRRNIFSKLKKKLKNKNGVKRKKLIDSMTGKLTWIVDELGKRKILSMLNFLRNSRNMKTELKSSVKKKT